MSFSTFRCSHIRGTTIIAQFPLFKWFILRVKCTKFDFGRSSAPNLAGEEGEGRPPKTLLRHPRHKILKPPLGRRRRRLSLAANTLAPPLGRWLVGKPMINFLFALIELSSLSVMHSGVMRRNAYSSAVFALKFYWIDQDFPRLLSQMYCHIFMVCSVDVTNIFIVCSGGSRHLV